VKLIDKLINFVKKYLWSNQTVTTKKPLTPSIKGLHGWMIELPCKPPRGLARWKIVIGVYVSQSSSEEFEVQLSHLNVEQGLPKPEKVTIHDTHVIQIVKKQLSGIDKRVLRKYILALGYVDGSQGKPTPNTVLRNITKRLCYDMINSSDGITLIGMEKSIRTSLIHWLGTDQMLTLIDVQHSPTSVSTEV
jgi:hypothetical protein